MRPWTWDNKLKSPVSVREPEEADPNADPKKRRKRRTKEEVDRSFVCPIPQCGKGYGWAN